VSYGDIFGSCRHNNDMFLILRRKNSNEKCTSLNTFAEVFHNLCDALQMINSLYAYHLIPILLETLLYDIFGIFVSIRYMKMYSALILLLSSFYIIIHFALKCAIAQIGSSTTFEAEEVLSTIGKIINKQPANDISRYALYNLLHQFRTRNLKLQSFFLTFNWNIVLAVSLNELLMKLYFRNLFFIRPHQQS
jgi:hypothetical protein